MPIEEFKEAVRQSCKDFAPLGVRLEESSEGEISIIVPDEWVMYCRYCAYWMMDYDDQREGVCWQDLSEHFLTIIDHLGFCIHFVSWDDSMPPILGMFPKEAKP